MASWVTTPSAGNDLMPSETRSANADQLRQKADSLDGLVAPYGRLAAFLTVATRNAAAAVSITGPTDEAARAYQQLSTAVNSNG